VECTPTVMMQIIIIIIIIIIIGGKYRRTNWWHQTKGGEMESVLREENQCVLHIHMKIV
jgi:hypothetical protein